MVYYGCMIISASRRTDIPAFYPRWFLERIRAGYCTVPNPFNHSQVAFISLAPKDVEVIVFWSRNPRPLFSYLPELDSRGFHYYFHFTLLDYPILLDTNNPPLVARLDTFRRLAERLRPQRVIWRYDPIVLTDTTPPDFHAERFSHIAKYLRGYTTRCVISLLDFYWKTHSRMKGFVQRSGSIWQPEDNVSKLGILVSNLADTAKCNGMEIVSCAEEIDLCAYGVRQGKCIDDALISELFGLDVSHSKDPGQRKVCNCVVSRDIGMYDSCLFGCQYCYATSSFKRARMNYMRHDPYSPSLLS